MSGDAPRLWGRTVTVRLRRVVPGTDGVAREAISVEGQVEAEDGTNSPFAGWVGLVNQLERLLTGRPSDH
jgi:hypothetical protein